MRLEPSMGKRNRSRIKKKSGITGSRKRVKVQVSGKACAPAKSKLKASPTPRKRNAHQSSIILPAGYRPSEAEPFMNERQLIYFRNKLLAWKEEIVRQNRETLQVLHEDTAQHADLADRATSETDRALELRARDRQRKLIAKIDAALARIEDGSYGYCAETGEPIGLRRLDARPIATLSLEAQERHERRERVFRED
jgi:DnaK suppressor protein